MDKHSDASQYREFQPRPVETLVLERFPIPLAENALQPEISELGVHLVQAAVTGSSRK